MLRTLLALLLFAAALPASAERLHISTENYPPYNVRDSQGRPSGVYMDQLKIIFERSGIEYQADILPWARALALAQSEPMHCVAAAARTPARQPLFKWVFPLHTDRNILVARKDHSLQINSLEDAKAYVVGTQRTDYTESVLKSLDFKRIDLSADFDTTLIKLAAGRIDLMPMSESSLNKLAPGEFVEVAVLTHQSLGMACNLSVPDPLIAKMQHVLNGIISDGTQRQIFEKQGLITRP
ncbi:MULTISPECIES: transporter substrate-binding domain-containing protein [unclassified Rhizobium]|uniref:substrate-binding periplasmic protein n=1 Tax=unclassified Rhizobium TaxID=2613769 RepID=UPI0028891132|nr:MULTISPECIES: transporter substrate-binding domain-containing protein [unclassified Rhizobium]